MVDDDGATGLEMLMDASKGLQVEVASAPDAEDPNEEDGPIPPVRLEGVDRLGGELRREASLLRPGPGVGDHVGRDVRAVEVESRFEQREDDPARPATEVEGRLTEPLDDAAEEGHLVRIGLIELRPPPSDEPVMPGA